MPIPTFIDAAGSLAIRTGRLLDAGRGALEPGRVLHVRDGRVAAVAGRDDGEPDGTPVLDLGGLTVLPGLIDTHSHLIGDVQTADIPATTTSAAQDVLT